MNLVIAVVNLFTESSPAYQLSTWNAIAGKHGFHYVALISDNAYKKVIGNKFENVTFIKTSSFPEDLANIFSDFKGPLQAEFDRLYDIFKPAKITCNMDFMLYKYIENYPCFKQIFVRQFFTKMHQVLCSYDVTFKDKNNIDKTLRQSLEETRCLRHADRVITNNSLTAQNIQDMVGVTAMVIPQYRNPEFFNSHQHTPNFYLKESYNIGRTDSIKNINALRPNKYKLLLIGNTLLSNESVQLPNTTHIKEFLPIEKWYPLVQHIPISLNPCLYETNGFAVQEALMMGKITVVNKNSGGNLLHIVDKENGFVIDFENDDYEQLLESLSINELKRISDNALNTIDKAQYNKSMEMYIEELV